MFSPETSFSEARIFCVVRFLRGSNFLFADPQTKVAFNLKRRNENAEYHTFFEIFLQKTILICSRVFFRCETCFYFIFKKLVFSQPCPKH